MLIRGDRFLVLRYSNGIYDCIKNHKEVLKNKGYCWFGKIGMIPSEKAIKEKLNSEHPLVLLYCQGNVSVCDLLEISTDKPKEGYPDYYKKFMYERNIFPQMYFKLGSIETCPQGIFADCVCLKSRKNLSFTIQKSMSSFFYGEYPTVEDPCSSMLIYHPQKKDVSMSNEQLQRGKINKDNNVIVDKNSCVYKKDMLCTNKRSVNYNYTCERPHNCLCQKPKEIE